MPEKETKLKIIITAVTDAAKNGLQRMNGMLTGVKNTATSVGTTLLKSFGLGMLLGSVTAIAATVIMLGKSFLSAAAAAESMQHSFTRALNGNSAGASRMIADLKGMKPIESGAALGAGKNLLNLGMNPQEVVSLLRQVGDLAEGDTATFSELAQSIGEAFTENSIGARELKSMTRAGIPIVAELARMYNKTGSEIKDMAGKGTLSFDDLKTAIANLTAEGGKFHGAMAEKMTELDGQWAIFTANLKKRGKEAADSWLPWMEKALSFTNKRLAAADDLKNGTQKDGVATAYNYDKNGDIMQPFRRMGANTLDAAGDLVGMKEPLSGMVNRATGYNNEIRMDITDAEKADLAAKRQAKAQNPDKTTVQLNRDAVNSAKREAFLAEDRGVTSQNTNAELDISRAANAQLEEKLRLLREEDEIKRKIYAGDERGAAILKALNDTRNVMCEKNPAADLTPEQTGRLTNAAGHMWDVEHNKALSDASKEMDRQLTYQRLIKQGKEDEAAAQEAVDRAKDAAGRDLYPDEEKKIRGDAKELFNLSHPNQAQQPDLRVDELTKVGAYNFNNNQPVNVIDIERNNLLKQINDNVAKLDGDQYELA